MPEEKRAPGPRIEPVPEETYPDLLPYEMERSEAIMGMMFAQDDQKLTQANKDNASQIRSGMLKAKMAKKNRWGHGWRPSPDMSDVPSMRDKYGMWIRVEQEGLPRDPLCERAKTERRMAFDNENDNIPATD